MEFPIQHFIKSTIVSFRQSIFDYTFYSKLIGYIILATIIIILLFAAYIKITFRFWSEQPVFHVYDFWYYLAPPGIVTPELPEKNRYCNFTNIEVVPYANVSKIQIDKFTRFIRNHFIQNKENQYLPTKQNIVSNFEGHNTSSFFSFYYEDEHLLDSKTNELVPSKKLVGTMTTRPLHVSIIKGGPNAYFDCYYVDYLCVDKMFRKKGIAPQIIQTHHYKQRHFNRNIQVSLFKREGVLTGIVPLCVYQTYGYNIANWDKPALLPINMSLVECGPSNLHFLLDFMKMNNSKRFDICITTDTSNFLELMKTKNVYVYMIIQDNKVLSCYFFRKSCTFIKKDVECITCFASINGLPDKARSIFNIGYLRALWAICDKNPLFQFAVIEDISDNNIIIDFLDTPYLTSPTAYFFYNFAYHTFHKQKVFVIC